MRPTQKPNSAAERRLPRPSPAPRPPRRHCYATWYNAQRHQAAARGAPSPFNDASAWMSRLLTDGVMQMRTFTHTAGRRFIISRPRARAPPGAMMDTCAQLKRTFMLAGERGVFCDNDRDRAAHGDSLILPYTVVAGVDVNASARAGPRLDLLYYRDTCPPTGGAEGAAGGWPDSDAPPDAPGPSLVRRMFEELGDGRGGAGVNVTCGCARCPQAVGQVEEQHAMEAAVFCPVMASETQASRRLPAAALAGCMPVLFGPPFHALPLAADIRYADFALVFNLTRYAAAAAAPPPPGEPRVPGELEPDAGLAGGVIRVENFAEAVEYLRALPEARLASMREALDEERLKFYYPPLPGFRQSVAGKLVVRRMCEYATRINVAAAAQRLAQKPADMPKIPKGGFQVQPEEEEAEGGGTGGGATQQAAQGEAAAAAGEGQLGGIGEDIEEAAAADAVDLGAAVLGAAAIEGDEPHSAAQAAS